MNEAPCHTDLVVIPGLTEAVRIEFYGEHHMGAEHVEIALPLPVSGIKRFYTTNGRAYFSTYSNQLVVYDSCLVIMLDLIAGTACHSFPPSSWYFEHFSETSETYRITLYNGNGGRRFLDIARSEANFQDGFGVIQRGVFPSASMPYASDRNA